MSNELVPLDQLSAMANSIAASNLFGIKTKDQAIALMLIAQAEGLHPATVARDYNIIQGRPAKTAEAMLRAFIVDGGRVQWHKLDDTCADATFSHAAGGEVRITWDMERASKAGLGGKDNWKKYPRQMLRSRTVSEGVRTVCPAATSGMYVPEEVQEFAKGRPEKDMGKADVVQPTAGVGPQPVKRTKEEKVAVIVERFGALHVTPEQLQNQLGKEIHLATKSDLEAAYAHFEAAEKDEFVQDMESEERAA